MRGPIEFGPNENTRIWLGVFGLLKARRRGIGLHAKIQAYNPEDRGADTMEANLMLGHPADARNYGIASEVLGSLGIEK